MIVCSCARISSGDIRRAVDWMRAADADAVLTPGKVYRALGKRPACGGCLDLFVRQLHLPRDGPLPAELQGLRNTLGEERRHEGRRQGHRVSERGSAQRADGDEPVLAALPAAE
ncbi:MAG TPA: (2Fe-2S)-binding protein [Thermohalobaculum sp.]|nr:(2Fe-2S)-binding protein [Thermohalobaculum sp.]